MGRWFRVLICLMAMNCFMVTNYVHAQSVASSTSTECVGDVAECYRVLAVEWQGRAQVERARRVAAEADAADARTLAGQWRDAAQAQVKPRTPDWVWPSVAATVVGAFIVGFAVAWRVPRPDSG